MSNVSMSYAFLPYEARAYSYYIASDSGARVVDNSLIFFFRCFSSTCINIYSFVLFHLVLIFLSVFFSGLQFVLLSFLEQRTG